MKKKIFGAFIVSLGCFDICCAMQNINPQRVNQSSVSNYMVPLNGFINSIPPNHRGDLLQRFDGLNALGGATRLNSFRSIVADAQVRWRQSGGGAVLQPPAQVQLQLQQPQQLQPQVRQLQQLQLQRLQQLQPQQLQPQQLQPQQLQPQVQQLQQLQLQRLQSQRLQSQRLQSQLVVQPQTQAQIQLQAPMHATQIDFFQTPALVIENYFRERSIFGTGRQIPDFRSFNMFFFKKVVEPLENRHMNPLVLDTFMDCCFGEYIDIARFCDFMEDEFSSNPTGFGMLCKALPDQHSLYIAGNLVRLSEDDNFFFPTIVISGVFVDVYIEGVEEPFQMRSFEYAIMKNPEASLVRIEQAIDSYNEFVRKCSEFLMDVSMSKQFDVVYSINDLFKDGYLLENFDGEYDLDEALFLSEDRAKELEIISLTTVDGTGIIDLYVKKNEYDKLSPEDKKLAKSLIEICHQRHYRLLTETRYDTADEKTRYEIYKRSYLTDMNDVIENGRYNKVADFGVAAGQFIAPNSQFYDLAPLLNVIRRFSPQVERMADAQFKIRFGNIFRRLLHLCFSPINGGKLVPRQPGIFGSSFDIQNLQDNTVCGWLDAYDENSVVGVSYLVATSDTDYIEASQPMSVHFRTSLQNIGNDYFNNYGIYSTPDITRYIAAKLEHVIFAIETSPTLDIDLLEFLAKIAGSFLQGFHHCNNGKTEAIFKVFPLLFEAEDLRMLSTQDMLKVLSRIMISKVISDNVQFHNYVGGLWKTTISAENASYFLIALIKLQGDYGAVTAGGDFYDRPDSNNLLKNFLENRKPQIWNALSDVTRGQISATIMLTPAIIKSVVQEAVSVPSFIDILLSEDYIAFTDMLISKYLADTGRAGFVPRNNDIKKQILVDILHTYGMLADRRNP